MKLRTYSLRSIKEGDRVVMRIEANVPITDGVVKESDASRIQAVISEILNLQKRGAKVILALHLGRPNGKRVTALSTQPVADYLAKYLSHKVYHSKSVVGVSVKKKINRMKNGDVLVLENVRFESGEKKNSVAFAKSLATLADVYINNAFGVSHRAHASVHAVGMYTKIFAGNLLAKEVQELSKKIKHPSVLIMGGIKLETKVPVIEHLASRVDAILTAGGIAVALVGIERKKSLYAGSHRISEMEQKQARYVMNNYSEKIHLPIDFRVLTSRTSKIKNASEIRSRAHLVDIGPKTVMHYKDILDGSKTVIWNGPLGYVEDRASEKGTLDIAKYIGKLPRARTVVGGGDTVAFLEKKKLADSFSFISTGGGAMLAFLSGTSLPGLERLRKK